MKNSVLSHIRDTEGINFVKEGIQIHKTGLYNTKTGKTLANLDPADFEMQNIIGRGGSGFVQKAFHRPTGIYFAIKYINAYDRSKRHQLMKDIRVLYKSHNRYLVKCYGAYFHEGIVGIVLEHMDIGSLASIFKTVKLHSLRLSEPVLAQITYQILKGMMYLHKHKHQVHRDIKPDNVLLNSLGQIKLTDFGISKELEKTAGLCNTFVGTATYMSPERIVGKSYSYPSDVWSLGIILYEIATLKYPYPQTEVCLELIENIINKPEPALPEDGTFSQEICDFVKKCLRKEPKERYSVVDLITSPWITRNTGDCSEFKKLVEVLGELNHNEDEAVKGLKSFQLQSMGSMKTMESMVPPKEEEEIPMEVESELETWNQMS